MRKRYLKTIEDVEALRNTDTKIYCDSFKRGYWKFVGGVLCKLYYNETTITYNTSFSINRYSNMLYIEVEDEPSEDDIGKLGWFSDADKKCKGYLSVLQIVRKRGDNVFVCSNGNCWKYFTPLTPEEVEKHTGYKVVNNKMQASEVADNKMQAKEEG